MRKSCLLAQSGHEIRVKAVYTLISIQIFGFDESTGCLTISVTFETPLFWDICWRNRLLYYWLNKQCGWFNFSSPPGPHYRALRALIILSKKVDLENMVNLVIVDNPVFTQVGQSQEVMGTDRDWYLGDQQPQALQNRAPCCQSGCTHFSGGLAPLATHLRSRNRSDCKHVTVSGMERMVLWYRMSRSSELKSVHSGGNSVSLLRDMSGRKEGRKRTREIECHACLHY